MGNLFQNSAQSSKPAPAATPATPAATTALGFDFNAGAPTVSAGALASGSSDRDQSVQVFKLKNANPEQTVQVLQSMSQSGNSSPQSSSSSQNSLLQQRSADTTVAFNTAPVPNGGDFKLGVVSDSFNTGAAKAEQPSPGLATAESVNLAKENRLLDEERTRELQQQVNPGHYLPSDTEPARVGVPDNHQPGQGPISGFGARESGNQFVSRYAYTAPMSGGLDQLRTTNGLAVNSGGNNFYNPGTAAIEPGTMDLNEALDRYGKLTGRTVMHGALPSD